MRTFLFAALALSALTSIVMAAEPTMLTDGQMDKITAGAASNIGVPTQASHGEAHASAGFFEACNAGQACQNYIHGGPTGLGNFNDARYAHSKSPPH